MTEQGEVNLLESAASWRYRKGLYLARQMHTQPIRQIAHSEHFIPLSQPKNRALLHESLQSPQVSTEKGTMGEGLTWSVGTLKRLPYGSKQSSSCPIHQPLQKNSDLRVSLFGITVPSPSTAHFGGQ